MPDTNTYLFLGLAASFGLVGALVASLYLRYRSLLKDEQTVKYLLEDDNT